MNTLCRFVTTRPTLSLVLAILLALPFLTQLPRVRTVDNVDYFTVEGDLDVAFYDTIKDTFGDDEFFVVVFSSPDLFSAPVLRMVADLTSELEALPEVREVQSLANVDFIHGSEEYFEVRPFLERIPDDRAGLDLLRSQALENRLYLDNLVSADGTTAALAVFPREHDPDDGTFRARLLEKTRAILDSHRDKVDRFHLAGWTVTNLSLSSSMKSDVATFIPLTYLLIAATTWLSFRNLRLTALALVNISVCTGATMGLFPLLGITLNNVTTIVPPLVMALALTDTVHIFSHLDSSLLDRPFRDGLRDVLSRVAVPCFLTSLTTAAGFISLIVSDIPPIKEFGYVASAGMIFEFIFSFFLLPPLLLLFEPGKVCIHGNRVAGYTAFLSRLSDFVRTWPRLICTVVFVTVAVSLWGASLVRVETNLLDYFKRSSELRRELAYVESRLSGVGTVDISLKADRADAFRDPANLAVIDGLQRYAESLDGVDRSMSFVDFLKDMNMSFNDENPEYYRIPDSLNMVSQYLLLYDSDDIDEFITPRYDHARILLRISEHSSAGQAGIIASLRCFIDATPHEGLHIRVTGRAVKDVNTIDALVRGQVESLALAAAVITAIMFLSLRSLRIGAMSLIPNMFPIVVNFGIMGILGIPLNTSTALISVVALGIAVDDTIHFLTGFNLRRDRGLDVAEALRQVMLDKGRGICASTLILVIGFSVLVLSRFVPTISFGGLSAVIMITAWIGDMIVLPAAMLAFRGRVPKPS
jgi:hypothetical protein